MQELTLGISSLDNVWVKILKSANHRLFTDASQDFVMSLSMVHARSGNVVLDEGIAR